MTTADVLERVAQTETIESETTSKLAQEVENILEKAGQTGSEPKAERVRLAYRVPFPGVRYYF